MHLLVKKPEKCYGVRPNIWNMGMYTMALIDLINDYKSKPVGLNDVHLLELECSSSIEVTPEDCAQANEFISKNNINKLRFSFTKKFKAREQILSLANNTSVNQLDFSQNTQKTLPVEELCTLLITCLTKSQHVSRLKLSDYNLNSADLAQMETLLKALGNTGITELDLSLNDLSEVLDVGLVKIANTFKHNKVVSLSVANNDLGSLLVDSLVNMVVAFNDSKLTSFNLSSNKLYKHFGSDLAQLIAAYANTEITDLNLSLNILGSINDLVVMIKALECTKILKLDLSENHLYKLEESQQIEILTALKGSQVKYLNLAHNGFEFCAAENLKQMLAGLNGAKVAEINLAGLEKHPEFKSIISSVPYSVKIVGINHEMVSAHNLIAAVYNKIINEDFYLQDIDIPEEYFGNVALITNLIETIRSEDNSLAKFTAASLCIGAINNGCDEYDTTSDYIAVCIQAMHIYLDCFKSNDANLFPQFYKIMASFYIEFTVNIEPYKNEEIFKTFEDYLQSFLVTIRNKLFPVAASIVAQQDPKYKISNCNPNESSCRSNNVDIDFWQIHPTCLFQYNNAKPFALKEAGSQAFTDIPKPQLMPALRY